MNLITIQQINDYLLCFLFIQLLIIMTEIQRNMYNFNNDLSEDTICGEYPFVRAFNHLPGQICRAWMSAWRWDHDGANNRCPENEKKKKKNWAELLSDGRVRIWRDKGPKWSVERQREKTGFSHGMRASKGLAQRGDEGSFGSSPSLHGGCCWASFLSRQSSLIFSLFFLLLNCFWSSRRSNRPPTKHLNSLTDCMKVALLWNEQKSQKCLQSNSPSLIKWALILVVSKHKLNYFPINYSDLRFTYNIMLKFLQCVIRRRSNGSSCIFSCRY